MTSRKYQATSKFTDNPIEYAALLGILLLGLVLRLYAVNTTGVGGSDTILYYALAERWLDGDFVFQIAHGAHVFRPVLLVFNALALFIFGHTDYAINLANILLDGCSMLLLAALAWTISRQWLVVITSVLVYACLPIAIWSSRQELPHTLSAFLVLLTVFIFVRALLVLSGRRQWVWLALSGISLGAAVMTHEELALLAVPLGIFLLIYRSNNSDDNLKDAVRRLCSFSFLPLVAALGIYFIERKIVERALERLFSGESGSNVFFPELAGRYLWNVVTGTSSALFAGLAGLAAVYVVLSISRQRKAARQPNLYWAAFLFCLPVAFVAIYAPLFNTIFSRGFLPFAAFMILGVTLVLTHISSRFSKLSFAAVLVPVLALLLASNLASYSAFAVGNRRYAKTWAEPIWPSVESLRKGFEELLIDARYVPSYATHWHYIYGALKDKVGPRGRLLVMPITTMYSPGRRALQTKAYFGDDAVFRVDFPGKAIAEIVAEKNVKWILFTTGQQRKVPRNVALYQYNGEWSKRHRVDIARDFGMTRYSVRAEYDQLLRYLQKVSAVPYTPFPTDSFEQRVARIWRLPQN